MHEGLDEAKAGAVGALTLGAWLKWDSDRVPDLYGSMAGARGLAAPTLTETQRSHQQPVYFDFRRTEDPVKL